MEIENDKCIYNYVPTLNSMVVCVNDPMAPHGSGATGVDDFNEYSGLKTTRRIIL